MGRSHQSLGGCPTTPATVAPLLHTVEPLRRMALNRLFAAVYSFAIIALLYRHAETLLSSTSLASFSVSLSLLTSDLVLAFMWASEQAFRMCPVCRKEFPENLKQIMREEEFPGMDVFICTADPYKEPPMSVVNTALSLMAFDYPTEKISVYLSDDGGSALTLFAFMEAAEFARYWLPYCRKNNIMERSPNQYFSCDHHHHRHHSRTSDTEKIKMMYENMRTRVEHVVENGKIDPEYIRNDQDHQVFDRWTHEFTRHDHPSVIQVLLENGRGKDIDGHPLPNLIYVSREKSRTSPHHFKAGALNALLRVSGIMTNSPVILTQDCDMYSNDPGAPLRAMCYFLDPSIRPSLGYVQFPQRFHGLNKHDIYASEYKRPFRINPMGFDGLRGPDYFGSGCFFQRRVFFGDPTTLLPPDIPELHPDHAVDNSIRSEAISALAHKVAGCNYEDKTQWGYRIGFRYGSLVEDYYTGYRLQCEGWRSIFCNPERPAFLGDMPITLLDSLNQLKRWCIGLYEVIFSKYNTLIFGAKYMGLLMALGYSHYSFWPIWSIPITTYAFLPQLALLNGVRVFPEISEIWFFLYISLFIGAYGQDLVEFVLAGGTARQWWSAQRIWLIRGISCFLFSTIEYLLKSLGIWTHGFTVTSKVLDSEQSKRYEQGIFEFGVPSSMFVPMTIAALVNLFVFIWGTVQVFSGSSKEGLCLQMLLSGFIILNSYPIYEAILLRTDDGRMPTKISVTATFLAGALYGAASFILN